MSGGHPKKLAACSGALAVFFMAASLKAADGEADPVVGGFGLALGELVETALTAGYVRYQYPDGGDVYVKGQQGEFFNERLVTATEAGGTITSIEARHRYGKLATRECRNNINLVFDEISNRYKSLTRRFDQPILAIGFDNASYFYLQYRANDRENRGRSIALVCGEIEGKTILSIEYKLSSPEYQMIRLREAELEKLQDEIDKREAAEKLRRRGINPDDF